MQWISVKKRLPNQWEYVLVNNGRKTFPAVFVKARKRYWLRTDGFGTKGGLEGSIKNVKYWMTMPS